MLQQKRCKICIGLSPCPNDTFIFDALLYKKIDTKNIDFSFYMDDVEQLNNKVIQEELDICKISCGVYHLVSRYYNILKTGGAIGSDVGPLLVVKDIKSVEQRNDFSVALPGVYTTAHLIFQYFFPTPRKKIFMPFHQIEDAVLTGAADAGVLIHENCFTYKKNGLKLMMNLGKQWEEVFKSPIPLGCVVAHKRLKKSIVLQVEQLIKESILYAWDHYPVLSSFVLKNAQSMKKEVLKKHIQAYVTSYTLGMGKEGMQSIIKVNKIATDAMSKRCY